MQILRFTLAFSLAVANTVVMGKNKRIEGDIQMPCHKITVSIILMLMAGGFAMMHPEQPETSWKEYNLSFWEIYHLKKTADDGNYEAAYGNHIESMRELLIYYNIVNTEESRRSMETYIQKLREIASTNKKEEDFYYADLNLPDY